MQSRNSLFSVGGSPGRPSHQFHGSLKFGITKTIWLGMRDTGKTYILSASDFCPMGFEELGLGPILKHSSFTEPTELARLVNIKTRGVERHSVPWIIVCCVLWSATRSRYRLAVCVSIPNFTRLSYSVLGTKNKFKRFYSSPYRRARCSW